MKKFGLAIAVMVLMGCSTVVPVDFDGSRADGTVTMGVSFGPYATFDGNWTQSEGIVLQRCEAWGYTGFEAFGGVRQRCFQQGLFGSCDAGELTRTYQCTTTVRPQ